MNSSGSKNEVSNITVESLVIKLKEFFKDKKAEDITTLFSGALSGMREYNSKGLPEDKSSDEYKKSISLFANPNKRPINEHFTMNFISFMEIYETLKENKLDLFKKFVVQLPELLQNLSNEMDAMQIDTDPTHQKNYLAVKDYVTQLEALVAADIKNLESSQILSRKK